MLGIGVLAEPNEQTDEYDVNGAERMIGQQFVITTGSTSSGSTADETEAEIQTQDDTVYDGGRRIYGDLLF